MALKTSEMWSESRQNSYFFPKNYKKSPSGWGLRPHAHSVTCLSCTNLLKTSPNFDRIERFLTCGSNPSSIANPGYEPNQTPSFWSFILCVIKSPSFQKLLMTSSHDLRFSLPPYSKFRLRLCIKSCAICIPDTGCCIWELFAHLHERLLTTLQRCKATNIRCIASSLKFLWYGSMEWNMEENFGMEWNMEENFSMEWNMD